MASMNVVILMGNMTRDPEVRFLPSEQQVAEFGLAMNRKFRTAAGEDREEVTFVDCTAFGKTAELIGEYFTKGKPIAIEGRLRYESWEDKNGGGKRSKVGVVVDSFHFVGSRDDGDGSGEDVPGSRSGPPPRRQQQGRPAGRSSAPAGRQPQTAAVSDEPAFDPDEIPF
jgi:single-strand DNA-binding protein